MANMHLDMSEVQEFAADLGRVPQELSRHALPALKKAAQNVKNEMQADLRGSSHRGFSAIASKVSYDDPTDGPSGYETEIGIEKEGAGKLGNLAIYGSHKGGGSHMPPEHFAELEMPAFERAVGDIAEELLS